MQREPRTQGTTGPTVGEALTMAGHKLRRADKNRIQGRNTST